MLTTESADISPSIVPITPAQLSFLATTPPSPPSFPTSQIQVFPDGPLGAKFAVVGDAPSLHCIKAGRVFQGPCGFLLENTLHEIGLPRGVPFLTMATRQRPPKDDPDEFFAQLVRERTQDHRLINDKWAGPVALAGRELVRKEILECRPDVVVTMGNAALWALTGLWGARKWRSSILQAEIDGYKFKVIPTYGSYAVLREYPLRQTFLHDFRRARGELEKGPIVLAPDYQFIIAPDYATAHTTLIAIIARLDAAEAPVALSCDIETRAGHTACVSIAWSPTEAICIPWMCVAGTGHYWTLEEETALIFELLKIWRHPRASLTWQNGAYDHQYEYRWHFLCPTMGWDTMIAHHAMFSISLKSLDYLSSLYCASHRYWKDDGRNWDPSTMPEEQYWHYNCEDSARTFEIREGEEAMVDHLASTSWPRLPEVIAFQHALQPAVVRMMFRGVRSDDYSRTKMDIALTASLTQIQSEVDYICGQPLNIRSPKQMIEFFYDTLDLTPEYNRKPDGTRGNRTCDDDALLKIQSRTALLRPLVERIQAMRSAGVFQSTFVKMRRDMDGRLRCSYNVAGTKTYRFSSSENAFGSGGNLQNIPSGDDAEDQVIPLPNIRELFLFDRGMTGFDLDGDSADLRIVTGESGCKTMQAYFASGAKPYVELAKEFYRDQTITKQHSSYKRMKALCHGTNYGGEAAGLSERIGLPVHDIDRAQKWYFGACPEIKDWQEDIKKQIVNRGFIENPFGYRLYNWDRPSRKLFNEALAWTPQSTVGILINKILLAIDQTMPDVQLLLQVHDSLTGQFPTEVAEERKTQLVALAASIEIPCTTGAITVPAGLKCSTRSWGECK